MRTTLALGFAFLLSTIAEGQDSPRQEYDLEKLAEEIFPLQDLDIDYSQLYENLAQILSNPLDLNSASHEQFRSLYILSELQITNLIRYRDEEGPLGSVYELQTIPEFDQFTFNRLLPFIIVASHEENIGSVARRILTEQNNYLLIRYNRTLEQRKGYLHDSISLPNYSGSPDRIYTRFRVARASDFSLGFTLEKDAGEPLRWAPRDNWYAADYNSFHLQLLNKGIVKNLIAGDYQAQFGQGLVLGSGFGMGKGSEPVTTIRRSNVGFLPYTSLNESGYFQGIALTLHPLKKFELHVFLSKTLADASYSDSTSLSLSSILSSGLHRTNNELEQRKNVTEGNYGAVASYKTQGLEVGSIFHFTAYGFPIVRNQTPYNQFYFQGNSNSNVSAYLNYSWNNTTFFGEIAKTINHGTAYVMGTLSSLTPQFDLALTYRNYSKDFHTFYGNALSENSTVQNETGYYLGWKYRFNKQHALAGYTDLFQFPWLRYRSYAPSAGHEWLFRYTYQPNKQIVLYLQAREESKARNRPENNNLYIIENGIKRNYLANLDYEMNQNLSFKSRIQYSSYSFQNAKTSGFALIQDVTFKIKKLTFTGRFALFDTEDYDNRQYVYEKDVWLAYSFPSYSGIGVRNYFMVHYPLSRKMDCWLRWSRTNYADRETIGSGNETIDGNSINDVKFQVRIKF